MGWSWLFLTDPSWRTQPASSYVRGGCCPLSVFFFSSYSPVSSDSLLFYALSKNQCQNHVFSGWQWPSKELQQRAASLRGLAVDQALLWSSVQQTSHVLQRAHLWSSKGAASELQTSGMENTCSVTSHPVFLQKKGSSAQEYVSRVFILHCFIPCQAGDHW